MALWEVVGGADKGGILVREGQALASAAAKDRLSTGATVRQLALAGDRLHYQLVEGTGTGPSEGWVSIKISGKDLCVPKREAAAAEDEVATEPVRPDGTEADSELKRKIEADAEALKKDDMFAKFVMKYKILGFPLPQPKLRVLCFHNAGSTESNYTGPGTPFITWAKSTKAVEVVAFDYPGRNYLIKHTKHTSAETIAHLLVAVAYEKLTDGVPYIVWSHSMGTWVAFEFLLLCRRAGLPLPLAGFFMAFPAPHMPEEMRPWRRSAGLSDTELKEELLNWDRDHFSGAGKVVFDQPAWAEQWEPLMRADFRVYDEYTFRHAGAPKFDFPIHAWHFSEEHFNTPEMIQLWKDWTSGPFDFEVMQDMGHLTCFYKPALKKRYFEKVTDLIKGYANV